MVSAFGTFCFIFPNNHEKSCSFFGKLATSTFQISDLATALLDFHSSISKDSI